MSATVVPSNISVVAGEEKGEASDKISWTTPRVPSTSSKRRAPIACLCCRQRKVRCNVAETGTPCTNCRLDDETCVIASKRRRIWGPLPSPPSADVAAPTPASRPESPKCTANEKPERCVSMSTRSRLPPYFSTGSPRLLEHDMAFLAAKGALTIPSSTLRDQLLKAYVENVHPIAPVVDIKRIVNVLDSRLKISTTGRISLLLFQAIMFAGSRSVSLEYLLSAGYQSRRDACRDLFQRAKLLYDFDYETMENMDSMVQFLVLMTYWHYSCNELKDSLHWLSIAVSLAYKLQFHRDPSKSTGMSISSQRHRKRMWWALYVADQTIALGLRQPARINCNEHDVPMLSLGDFEDTELPDGPSCLPMESTILRNAGAQRELAIAFIERAKLSTCVNRILATKFALGSSFAKSLRNRSTFSASFDAVYSMWEPEATMHSPQDELQLWKANSMGDADAETHNGILQPCKDLVSSHALTNMIYYAALSLFAQPSSAGATQFFSGQNVATEHDSGTATRDEISRMVSWLGNFRLVRSLPTIYVLLLPSVLAYIKEASRLDDESEAAIVDCLQRLEQNLKPSDAFRSDTAARHTNLMETLARAIRVVKTSPPPPPPLDAEMVQNALYLEEDAMADDVSTPSVICSSATEDLMDVALLKEWMEQGLADVYGSSSQEEDQAQSPYFVLSPPDSENYGSNFEG